MKSLLIIYPHDSTTVFLTESFYELQKEIKSATFFEIFPTEDSHNECIKLIPKYEKIIFMGHGSFFKLSSAAAENFKKDCLVTVHDIIALGEKDWILFSCNSNDLLRKCLTYKIGGIGFGNLPTDFNDIQGAREFEPFAYPNVNQNVIEGFKKSINWIITKSILALCRENLSNRDYYNRLTLLITFRMLEVLKDPKNIEQREIAKLLFDMKSEAILA